MSTFFRHAFLPFLDFWENWDGAAVLMSAIFAVVELQCEAVFEIVERF
jgi:hypothetical protein